MEVLLYTYSDASLKVKNLTTTSTNTSQLVILNGNSYNGSYSGDLDVYKYWVISLWSNPFNIFPELTFLPTTPDDNFPYDAMQVFYVYKLGDYNSGYKLDTTTNMTIKWKLLCIPR